VSGGNEFSRTFVVDPMPHAGISYAIAAAPRELSALAARFDLLALDRLEARGWIGPDGPRGRIALEGRLEAAVTQACVTTLEPVPGQVATDFRRLFGPLGDTPTTGEVLVDPLAEEIEPLPGRELDVGEIVAEELLLALDPYPRAPGAELPAPRSVDPEDGPFAALARRRLA
jgi:uncharacterized metal-binding protein YceD (DUF177 family)